MVEIPVVRTERECEDCGTAVPVAWPFTPDETRPMSLSYLFDTDLGDDLPLSGTDRRLVYECPDCGARVDHVKKAIIAAYRDGGAEPIEADLACALCPNDATGFDSDGYRTTPLCRSCLGRR
jgi:hypothetical protein